MGKVKLYTKLLLTQLKTRFKKPKEYAIPRCGVSFTKMKKLAEDAQGIKVVENQDTKASTFLVTAKAPEIAFSFATQVYEHIISGIKSPSRKDQKRLNEMAIFLKQLEPQMKDFDLYREASTLLQ